MSDLRLGETVDPTAHERTGEPVAIDPDDLTTHGVIVGMTGSGKTGLGVVMLEEALLAGVPTLVIDPKGDMTNLALAFAGLDAASFAPWVSEGDPAAVAQTWKDGLASWGLDGSHVGVLAAGRTITVYTPGSTAGVPLNLVGSMAAPKTTDEEARRDEVDGLVGGLLGMLGIESDPLAGREHILLANLIDRAWSAGTDLDLGQLVGQVQEPPIRKLGVLELDSFYPPADRTKLALQLNGLLASPAFAAWGQGQAVDMDALLAPSPVPACSVVYLAHLSDQERQFVVSLLLTKLVTWMRGQQGTPHLRALVYMDEVFGYVPPTAAPPAKKPILTILKQARAFGVGMVLSTQNPVDLDYKAISNAGTWMVGRLGTERDKERLLEGMRSAAGTVDTDALAATISGLGKREFVLHQAGEPAPTVFTSRWALDYLAGPLTKEQLRVLPGQPAAGAAPADEPVAAAVPQADDHVSVKPAVADAVAERWVAPATPWLAQVGGDPAGRTLRAGLAFRVRLLFDDTKADLRLEQEYECVQVGIGGGFDPERALAVDYDDRDLVEVEPAGMTYELSDGAIDSKTFFTNASKALTDHLYRTQSLRILRNDALKVFSRPGESEADFTARCAAVAQEKADAESAVVRDKLERKHAVVQEALREAQQRAADAKSNEGESKQHELLAGAGDLLGSLLGGRNRTKSIVSKIKGASSRRSQSARAGDRVESALARVEAKRAELDELIAELQDELIDIDAAWDAKAADFTGADVALEKADIAITDSALIWVPVQI